MEFVSNNIFTDLTEEETAALNGGTRCRPIWKIICRPVPPSSSRRRFCLRRLVFICL
jgi:hypothetical protein